MKRSRSFPFAAVASAIAVAALAASAHAASFDSPLGGPAWAGGSSTVPVSALAMPSRWLDLSRMHVSSEFTFGSSSGFGSGGLQVTRLSYRFGAPLQMRVSLGNAFGAGVRDGGKFFLEGLDLHYRPFGSMSVNVQYRNLRSPLQSPYGYGYGYGYGLYADPWYSNRSRLFIP